MTPNVYYESRKREVQTRPIYELLGELEHLKIKTRLINEMSVSVIVVYYESRNRELKIRLMNEGRYDPRLKDRVEESCHGVSWHIATVSGKIPVLRYRGIYGAS